MNSKANSDKLIVVHAWVFSNNSGIGQRQICQLWYNEGSEERNITDFSDCAITEKRYIIIATRSKS